MLTAVKKVIGDKDSRRLKKYNSMVEQINQLESKFSAFSDDELKAMTPRFKEQLENGKTIDDLKAEAFAVVREASKRVLGLRHYDVQLIGGLVLTEGNIAEMATGEGKTLVASLPSYLRALEGKGVHVVTANEYLARRDCELIGQIHEFLGLTVGLNVPQMHPSAKVQAYQADITYGIGTEFGFDYLRDNMVQDVSQRVQRPYHYAIIDEIDSVLIDEAKTPLIIAGKTTASAELHNVCAKIARSFKEDQDYTFDPETKATNFTDDGITKVERAFGIDNLYDLQHQTLYHYTVQGLRAHVMFKRDVDYIVDEGEIKLVDMFTGRIMDGRTLSDGLHQAIEAKEGLQVTEENKTQASVTIQNYFRMYPLLSGMTGTAKTEEKEFQHVYGMDVAQIPTNRPVVREDMEDKIYKTAEDKYKAVTKEVIERHAKGQPILIGTTSILQSEKVAEYLDEVNLPYQLLNAKSVEQEVRLISLAGQRGQITIATNMAGRGTDIMLGEDVAELGGLFVLGTEKHESRRIDNQLKGRSGRQGDPGGSQFFYSLEDNMFRRFAHEELEKYGPSFQTDETGLIISKKIYKFVERTQKISEGSNFAIREYNLKLDDVINDQREVIYSLRNRILASEEIRPFVIDMLHSYAKQKIEEVCHEDLVPEEWPLEELRNDINALLVQTEITFPKEVNDIEDIEKAVNTHIKEYIEKLDTLKEVTSIHTTLKKLIMQTMDILWIRHLDTMHRLKEGIGIRHYQQEDPLRLYQKEGLEIFTIMYQDIERESSQQLARLAQAMLSPTKK